MAVMPKFVVGATVQRREVLHGDVWMTMPVQVRLVASTTNRPVGYSVAAVTGIPLHLYV